MGLTNHVLGTNIRYYKDLDELPDDTFVLMYERFVPTFNFSNKIISRNAKTHGDDWYHNVVNFHKNDLEYKIVHATNLPKYSVQ